MREHWIVDPGNTYVQVWRRKPEGGFDPGELRDRPRDLSPIASRVLGGFAADPKGPFARLD